MQVSLEKAAMNIFPRILLQNPKKIQKVEIWEDQDGQSTQ